MPISYEQINQLNINNIKSENECNGILNKIWLF